MQFDLAEDLDIASLDLGDTVGRGGVGTVHRLLGQPDLVVKLFHQELALGADAVPRLRRLVAQYRSLQPSLRTQLLEGFAWPVALVRRDTQVVGYAMPLVSSEYFIDLALPSGRTRRVQAEVQLLLTKAEWRRARGIAPLEEAARVDLVLSLASSLATLHQLGIVFGDLSSRNILFRLGQWPRTYLVDVDHAGPPGAMAVQSPDWTAPEQVTSEASDTYKLALFAGRMFDGTTIGSGSLLELVAAGLSSDPAQRPPPAAWVAALREFREE